jgi:hypothetical protein
LEGVVEFVSVNGASLPATHTIWNSLGREARGRFEIAADLVIVDTDFGLSDLKIAAYPTFSLAFYVIGPLDLSGSIKSPLCLARQRANGGVRFDILTYADGAYAPVEPISGSVLPGALGCTTAINLGFYLFRRVLDISMDELGIANLIDRTREPPEELPFSDAFVLDFLRQEGFVRVERAFGESECPNYPECMGQPGMICDFDKAKCRQG